MAGHLHEAPVLFLSSNPSISEDEPYPVWNDTAETRIRFFDERFGDAPGQVRDGIRGPLKMQAPDGSWHASPTQFWVACRSNMRFLLQRDPVPGVDYAMTEIVHCKSRAESGVAKATTTCTQMWLERIMAASGARLVVTLGDHARKAFAAHLGLDPIPYWRSRAVKVGGEDRLWMAALHPNARARRKWSECISDDTLNAMRSWLEVESAPPPKATSEWVRTPQEDSNGRLTDSQSAVSDESRVIVAQVDLDIEALISRVAAQRPGELTYDVHSGYVDLRAVKTGKRFGRMVGEDSLMLVLRTADAQRAQAAFGGYVDDNGAESEWEIFAGQLPSAGRDSIIVTILRALAFAAGDHLPRRSR